MAPGPPAPPACRPGRLRRATTRRGCPRGPLRRPAAAIRGRRASSCIQGRGGRPEARCAHAGRSGVTASHASAGAPGRGHPRGDLGGERAPVTAQHPGDRVHVLSRGDAGGPAPERRAACRFEQRRQRAQHFESPPVAVLRPGAETRRDARRGVREVGHRGSPERPFAPAVNSAASAAAAARASVASSAVSGCGASKPAIASAGDGDRARGARGEGGADRGEPALGALGDRAGFRARRFLARRGFQFGLRDPLARRRARRRGRARSHPPPHALPRGRRSRASPECASWPGAPIREQTRTHPPAPCCAAPVQGGLICISLPRVRARRLAVDRRSRRRRARADVLRQPLHPRAVRRAPHEVFRPRCR